MKHVVLYVGHLYKPFWTKKNDRVGRGGQGRSKYCPEWASLLALEPSRGPQMGQGPQKWTQINQGQLGGSFGSISGVLDPFRGLERAPKPKARPILGNIWTLSDPPCQPGQICLVQNGLYRGIGGKLTQDTKNPDILFGYLLKRDDCIKRSYRGQH